MHRTCHSIAAPQQLREKLAQEHFGKTWDELTVDEQKEAEGEAWSHVGW